MRSSTAVSMAFAASVLLLGFGAPGQTWVETHPTRIDTGDRTPAPDMQAQRDKAPGLRAVYQEAQARPLTDEANRNQTAGPDGATLNRPENAASPLFRHE